MTDQQNRWADVATAISDRIATLGMTKAEVIRASGVSAKTLDGYLVGSPILRIDKKRDLCKALGWTINSVDLILAGQPPQLSWPDDDNNPGGAALPAPDIQMAARIGKLDDEARAKVLDLLNELLSE